MLQSMRDGASSLLIKIILFGFLTMAVLGLVLSDIGGFFRGGTTSTTVAQIGDAKYDIRDFDRHLRAQAQRLNITLSEAFDLGLPGLLVQEQANQMTLRRELSKVGLRVDDIFIAERANQLINALLGNQAPENVNRAALFSQLLRSMGITEQQYINETKADIAEDLFLKPLDDLIRPYSGVADQLYAQQMERRTAETLIVTADKNLPAPTDEDLQKFYDENKELYRTKEFRTISIVKIESEAVKNEIDISDELLRAEYNNRLESYTTAETRRISQAIVSDTETAQKILEAAQKSKNLKNAVQQITGDNSAFIDAADYTEREMITDISKQAFAAKNNDFVGPVETSLGFIVAYIERVTPARVKNYNEVREDLLKNMREDRLTRVLFDLSNGFDDMVAGGMSIHEAANANELDVVTFEMVDGVGYTQDGKTHKLNADFSSNVTRLLEEAFALGAGDTSTAIENENGDIFFVSADAVEPSFIPEFDAIKQTVKTEWTRQRDSDNSREKARDIVEKIRAGENISGFKNAGTFQRHDESSAQFPRTAISALFQLREIGHVTHIPANESNQMIIRLRDIRYPESTERKDASRFAELRGDIMQNIEKDMREVLMREWLEGMKIKVNHNVINRQYEDFIGVRP